MKKTFKRIIALAIVLCTLGAMMIPGVSAAGQEYVYDFTVAVNELGVASGWLATNTTSVQKLDDNFGTVNMWNLCKTASGSVIYKAAYACRQAIYGNGMQVKFTAANLETYYPFEIVTPATGAYTMSVTACYDHNATAAGVYIIEKPAAGITGSADVPVYTDESVLIHQPIDVSVTNNNSTEHTFDGIDAVRLDANKQYIAVAYAIGSGVDGYIRICNFTLKPAATYDYSVTYNANYEGADPATVADDENVAGSTDAERQITLDAPFVRPGYVLKGWATTADGSVKYKANDTVALTAAAPSLNLYAVWVKDIAFGPETIDFRKMGTEAGIKDYESSSDYLITGSNSFKTQGLKLEAAYNDGYGFAIEAGTRNTANAVRFDAGYLQMSSVGKNAAIGTFTAYAIKLRAPGTGKYNVSLQYLARNYKETADELQVYVVPKGDILINNNSYDLGNAINNNSAHPLKNSDGSVAVYLGDANRVISTTVQDSTVPNSGNLRTALDATKIIEMQAGTEYLVIFAYRETNAATANGTPSCNVELSMLQFIPYAPEASVEGKYEGSLAGALDAAVAGDTIKLLQDVTAESVNLPAGVTLNLNGMTLTADAVVGTVADSTDGNGFINVATADDAVLEGAANQVALWDNTTGAEGYRVFTYDFKTYGVVDEEDAAPALESEIAFYEYEEKYLEGHDNRFLGVMPGMKTAYDENDGSLNWRVEVASASWQFRPEGGGNSFSSGNQSLYYIGAQDQWMAVRFRSPGAGQFQVTIGTGASTTGADCDIYFIKASEVDKALGENAAAYAQQIADNAYANSTAFNAVRDAVKAAFTGKTPVMHTMCLADKASSYNGSFFFEENTEYIMVMDINGGREYTTNSGATALGGNIYIKGMEFYRAEKTVSDQTFWSDLEFTNDAAYQYIPTAGLQIGFKMSTLEDPALAVAENWKDCPMPAAVVNAWADAEANPEDKTNYGFYIRVRGFESLKADTTVTCVPYIKVGTQTIYAGAKTYDYKVPVAE